jgi:6-phosphogluconolactonase
MSEVEWWEFDSLDELAEQVAGDIGFVAESAIEARGNARLALPGSAIPGVVYEALLAQQLAWDKVTIVPTDDILVPAGDDRSHFGYLQGRFRTKGCELFPLVDAALLDDYREAGRRADERLQSLHWPLDLACLSVGEEGETASILPGPDFERAVAGPRGRRAIGLRPDPLPQTMPFDRVTLTADALSSARTVMVVLHGAGPREQLERAIGEGPLSGHAIGRVLAALDADVDIFWSAG